MFVCFFSERACDQNETEIVVMSTSTICDETQVQQELKQDFSKLARIPHLAGTWGDTVNLSLIQLRAMARASCDEELCISVVTVRTIVFAVVIESEGRRKSVDCRLFDQFISSTL